MKKVYTAIILIVLLCGGVLSANYIFLQRHMNEVLKEDPRNDGIRNKFFLGPFLVFGIEKTQPLSFVKVWWPFTFSFLHLRVEENDLGHIHFTAVFQFNEIF